MTDLKTTTSIVKLVLENNERARNSDSYLYLRVLDHWGKQRDIDATQWPVEALLLYMSDFGIPPFESVRRARQKIQQTYPHLAACKKVAEQRTANEEVYRAYAQGVTNV